MQYDLKGVCHLRSNRGGKGFPGRQSIHYLLAFIRFRIKSFVRLTLWSSDFLGVISDRTILAFGNFSLIFCISLKISISTSSGVFVSRLLHPTLINMQYRGVGIVFIYHATDRSDGTSGLLLYVLRPPEFIEVQDSPIWVNTEDTLFLIRVVWWSLWQSTGASDDPEGGGTRGPCRGRNPLLFRQDGGLIYIIWIVCVRVLVRLNQSTY